MYHLLSFSLNFIFIISLCVQSFNIFSWQFSVEKSHFPSTLNPFYFPMMVLWQFNMTTLHIVAASAMKIEKQTEKSFACCVWRKRVRRTSFESCFLTENVIRFVNWKSITKGDKINKCERFHRRVRKNITIFATCGSYSNYSWF